MYLLAICLKMILPGHCSRRLIFLNTTFQNGNTSHRNHLQSTAQMNNRTIIVLQGPDGTPQDLSPSRTDQRLLCGTTTASSHKNVERCSWPFSRLQPEYRRCHQYAAGHRDPSGALSPLATTQSTPAAQFCQLTNNQETRAKSCPVLTQINATQTAAVKLSPRATPLRQQDMSDPDANCDPATKI